VLGFAPVWQTLDEYGNKEEKTLFWVALPWNISYLRVI
jgi:hypothetical protein